MNIIIKVKLLFVGFQRLTAFSLQPKQPEYLHMKSFFTYIKQGFSRKLSRDRLAGENGYSDIRASLKNLHPFIRRHWRKELFYTIRFFSGKMHILGHESMEQEANVSSRLQELLTSIPLIKAFSTEDRTAKRIISAWKKTFQMVSCQ